MIGFILLTGGIFLAFSGIFTLDWKTTLEGIAMAIFGLVIMEAGKEQSIATGPVIKKKK